LPSDFFFSEALRRAEERADALAAKLERSEKAREKAEKDAAVVEGLRQRLQTAEDSLSDKVTQQIERENTIVARFDTQNRRFTSKLFTALYYFASAFAHVVISNLDELVFSSSRGGWVKCLLYMKKPRIVSSMLSLFWS
jgi:hypothetical protein